MKYRFFRWPENKVKAVTFTYDDAIEPDLILIDLFKKYGFRCTFNVAGTQFTEESVHGRWTEEHARNCIYQNGHEVAVHGAQHKSLAITDPKDWVRDLLASRSFLEKYYDRIIRGMAYPDRGGFTDETYAVLRALDFTFARQGGLSHDFFIPQDWLKWCCTTRNRDPQMLELAQKFMEEQPREKYISQRDALLFSCWGHSFEFPPDKWHLVDDLGAIIGNKDDIWYATNSEIYEYCHAYDQLIYSCDNTKIYNPTVTTIWLEIDQVDYVIRPGETLRLE